MSEGLVSLLDPLMLSFLVASAAFLWVIWKLLSTPDDPRSGSAAGPDDEPATREGEGDTGRPPSSGSGREGKRSART